MKFLTASKGAAHFTSRQFREFVRSIVGDDDYIAGVTQTPTVEVSGNGIVFPDFMLIHNGGLFLIENGDEVTHENGIQGMKRIDLVVARYTKTIEGVEDGTLMIIKGTSTAENPNAPSYISQNMQDENVYADDCPLMEIEYNGLDIVDMRFLPEVLDNLEGLRNALTTTHILTSTDSLDDLLENGVYYAFDNPTIRTLLANSEIEIPEEASDFWAVGLFVEVCQGVDSKGPDDVTAQPTQHLRVYFKKDKADTSYRYEYDRVHNFIGSAANGSSWAAWKYATTMPAAEEENVACLYNDSDYTSYSYSLDSMTEPGTYFMSLNDTMRKKYPSLFTPLDGYNAARAIMEVAEMEKEGSMVYAQTMTILFPVVENGISTFKTMTASRINYGEPGMRTWKTSVGDLMSSAGGNEVFYIASASDFAKYANGFDSMTTPGTYFIYPKLTGITDTYPELFTPKDGYIATVAVMEVGTYEEGSTDAPHQFMTIYFPVTVNGESTLETMTATRINLGESGMRTWKISKGDLSNIFIAEYGAATLDEILDALGSGKSCFCNYGNTLMSLISYGPASVQFGCFSMSNARGESAFYTIVTVNSSGWIKPEVTKYTKTSEISESSTNDEIPTALAVQNTRTHYTENEGQTTVILEETDYGEIDEFVYLEQELEIEAGKTYIVTWNGIEYECEAKGYAMDGTAFVGLGNASLLSLGKDTGEPFAIGVLTGKSMTMMMPSGAVEGSVSVPVAVGIVRNDEVVHKLPNKYLDLDWLPKKERKQTYILNETIEFNASASHTMSLTQQFFITEGEEYTVNWNGTEYVCEGKVLTDGTINIYYIGNSGLTSLTGKVDTGEPFIYWYHADVTNSVIAFAKLTKEDTTTETVAISVKGLADVYDKIPVEYLPDSYTIPTDLDTGLVMNEIGLANDALNDGRRVYATKNGVLGQVIHLDYDSVDGMMHRIWFVTNNKMWHIWSYNYENGMAVPHSLVVGLMPDVSGTRGYSVPVPSGMTAGQIVRLKSGNDSLTAYDLEWEAVDPWVIESSTEGSTKKFKISVDDDGNITTTEVTS